MHTTMLRLVIALSLVFGGVSYSYGATVTPSTIDTINSITLEDTTETITMDANGKPITILGITFSLEAFTTDMLIPGIAQRDDSVIINYPLRYLFESRNKEVLTDGFAAAIIIPDYGSTSAAYRIPKGERRTFTLLTAFAGSRESDEARLRIIDLPLSGPGFKKPLRLNPSEVGDLKSRLAETN